MSAPVRFFMELAELTGSYPILDGAEEAGRLEVIPQGGYLRFRALCRPSGQGLMRLTAEGPGGPVSLGVLTPAGSGWSLDRRFSPAELRRLGLTGLRGCRILRREPEGWLPEPDPGRLFRDPFLRRLWSGVAGAVTRLAEGERQLAVPLEGAFPLLPVFRLGSVRALEGKLHLVFAVHDGSPAIISAEAGQNTSGDPKPKRNGSERDDESDDEGAHRAGRPDPA